MDSNLPVRRGSRQGTKEMITPTQLFPRSATVRTLTPRLTKTINIPTTLGRAWKDPGKKHNSKPLHNTPYPVPQLRDLRFHHHTTRVWRMSRCVPPVRVRVSSPAPAPPPPPRVLATVDPAYPATLAGAQWGTSAEERAQRVIWRLYRKRPSPSPCGELCHLAPTTNPSPPPLPPPPGPRAAHEP